MRAIFAIVVVFLLALGDARRGPKWNELQGYTFEAYLRDFGHRYTRGSDEYARRQATFTENLREIIAHNADDSQTYKKGVNQFSDWTEAEWKRYNTLKVKAPKGAVKTHVADSNAVFPKFVDWRKNTAPRVITGVKNQGACGNCWAHSAAESVESYFALLTGQLPVLSTQQITSCTLADDGCGGGDYFDGWTYISGTTGLNEEWVYPFTDFFAANETMQATSPCKNVTTQFLPNFPWYPKAGVVNMTAVNTNDAASTMSALATQGPQSIAVAASTWMSYEGGIYQNNGTNPADWEIDHAVQLVGYGFDYAMNMNYWIVRNSWGTQWGELGYIRLRKYDTTAEPCGVDIAANQTVCGTSGLLSFTAFPTVAILNITNP